ncbi:hypothetical protein [Ensifer canadensis]
MPDAETEKPVAPSMAKDAPIVAPTPDEAATAVEAAAIDVENDLRIEGMGGVVVETGSEKVRSNISPELAHATARVDRPRRQTRVGKSSAPNVAVAAGVEYGALNSDARVPPTAFADEVAALDEDIRQLRRQLAKKLSLQNAQLKKMLERF